MEDTVNNNNTTNVNSNTLDGGDFEQSLDTESNYVETVNIGLVEQQLLLNNNSSKNTASAVVEAVGISLCTSSQVENKEIERSYCSLMRQQLFLSHNSNTTASVDVEAVGIR